MCTSHLSSDAMDKQLRYVTSASMGLALVLIIAKGGVWIASESVAILGSLLDSVLDFVASFINFFAVRYALLPADLDHRFGHGKAEPLAGLGQGAFIFISSIFLFEQGLFQFMNPQPVPYSFWGIVIIAVSIVLTLGLVMYQNYVMRRVSSLVLACDALHYKSDLFMNLGIILSLLLVNFGGALWVDGLAGMVVAGIILWSSVTILRKSYDELMDKELDEGTRRRLIKLINHDARIKKVEDLRTRTAGRKIILQCYVLLSPLISLKEVHDIIDSAKRRVMEKYSNADVLISPKAFTK